jgi:hypothetical protein
MKTSVLRAAVLSLFVGGPTLTLDYAGLCVCYSSWSLRQGLLTVLTILRVLWSTVRVQVRFVPGSTFAERYHAGQAGDSALSKAVDSWRQWCTNHRTVAQQENTSTLPCIINEVSRAQIGRHPDSRIDWRGVSANSHPDKHTFDSLTGTCSRGPLPKFPT